MAERKHVSHSLERFSYQYKVPVGIPVPDFPSPNYHVDFPKGSFRERNFFGDDFAHRFTLEFAPIPTPHTENGQFSFTEGSFGLWFSQFVKSFDNYLAKPGNDMPGLVLTQDTGGLFFVQTKAVLGNPDTVYIDNISAPPKHHVIAAILGHPVDHDKHVSSEYPSIDEVHWVCQNPWDTNVFIDKSGISILTVTPAFYLGLQSHLEDNKSLDEPITRATIRDYFNYMNLSLFTNYDTTTSTERNRRLMANFATSVLGIEFRRLHRLNGKGLPQFRDELIFTPNPVPAEKIEEVIAFKERVIKGLNAGIHRP